tara:strand:- start:3193 stop:3933 length:741 start_codon:yes stop_codon:yes gene_type:complete
MEDNFFYVIIAAIMQGLTEFLPISSSGHLIIIKDIFNYEVKDFSFEIMLHLGTVFSIIIYYYNDLIKFLEPNKENLNNIKLIIIACLPISIFGLIFKDFIELNFNDLNYLPYTYLISAIALLSTKFFNGKKKLNKYIIIIMGLFQILALFPGVSRSGITISTLLILGVNKEDAIKFSFIIAIPLIVGAAILNGDFSFNIVSIVGVFISFIFGWMAIYLSNILLKNKKYWMFSIYCFIISLIILFLN